MAGDDERFDAVAEALGVSGAYTHAAGHRVAVSPEIRRRLLSELGYPGSSLSGLEEALRERDDQAWRRGLPAVVVGSGEASRSVPISLPEEGWRGSLAVRLVDEDGQEDAWSVSAAILPPVARRTIDGAAWQQRRLVLPRRLPHGYHRLTIEAGRRRMETQLIVTPARCRLPAPLGEGRRSWGLSVQLYGLRSRAGGDIGDFADLAILVREARELGASFVGVSPLHALFLERPDRCTPYSPNSRLFLNPLAIATGPKGAGAGPDLIDYAAATRRKLEELERIYHWFRDSEDGRLMRADAGRPERLRLRQFATFEALRERFAFGGPGGAWSPWWKWPEAYRRPDSPAVAAFAKDNAGRVDFHLFLQWEAIRQLRAIGGELALYRDMAVGIDRDGADAWMLQDCLPQGVSLGCPPDLRNPLGQDWGVVPFSPERLRDQAYGPFMETVRANMRHAGLLRLDHAFQLLRLYWIPLGAGADEGGYVRYPMDDLLGILALESHRNWCAVVAEDLGTIPRGFRERLMGWDTLSSRILHRERGEGRSYLPPASYPERATVATGTHDQATLTGFWRGRDVEVRTALDLYPSPAAARQAAADREQDRSRLVEAVREHAEFAGEPGTPAAGPGDDLVVAVHRFLARTPCRLMLVQPDDLTGEVDQVNVPATVDRHPNWRRRYKVAVEDFATQPLVRRVAAMLRQEGRAAGEEGQ